MKENFTYKTHGVCSRSIEISVDDGIVSEIKFNGGCPGNTLGVASLVKGMPVEEVVSRLKGIRCGFKPTSCPDQLATALIEHFNLEKANV